MCVPPLANQRADAYATSIFIEISLYLFLINGNGVINLRYDRKFV